MGREIEFDSLLMKVVESGEFPEVEAELRRTRR